jgi:hypothetical protein
MRDEHAVERIAMSAEDRATLSSPVKRGRGTTRSVVEGARGSIFNHRRRCPNDPIGYVVVRSHCFDSRDSHNHHALRLEPGVTAPIAFRPILHVVAHAVDLDGESRLGAEEVKNVGSDRMLPSKGRASGRAIAEPAP